MSQLNIRQHASLSYAPRTYHNAQTADLTVAFAIDFTTAGEKLTHKASDGNYLSIKIGKPVEEAVADLVDAMDMRSVKVLNVAGNGIYTLVKHGWTQDKVNAFVFNVISQAHAAHPVEKIISGGQTGVDIAGIVAAYALGIDAEATLPRGFMQRNTDGIDRFLTAGMIEQQVISGAKILNGLPESNFTFFFGADNPLSNWHIAHFELDGMTFNCVEQYMMWKKAQLFGDTEIAEKIMKESHPREQKAKGREVRNFDEEVWKQHRESIVTDGCMAKFLQNKHLQPVLTATVGTTMVEASKFDRIWGVGLSADNPELPKPFTHTKQPLIGYF